MKRAFLPAIAVILSMTLGAAAASAAVNPDLLALMPPDTTILFGVQAQKVMASPFGQYALAQLPASNGMVLFASATGFDYQHDLQEIVAASDGKGSRPTLILGRGNFQPSKFLALAAVSGANIADYNGRQIVTPAKSRASLAFLDPSTLAIGSTAALQSTIDRYAGRVQFSGPLAEKATAASTTGDAWFATLTPASQLVNQNATVVPGNVLQQVLEVSAGVQFNDTGAVAASELTTASSQQAHLLQGVLQFIAAMAQSNGLPDPNAARAAALFSGAQFTVNGTSLDIAIPIPEQTLEQMYSSRPKPVKKAAVR